jgi:class 3 adenylate cyclase
MAQHIPNATMVELDSGDHMLWFHDALDVLADEIVDFALGAAPTLDTSRVLATVLSVDGSPERTGRLIDRYRGRIVLRAGDGVLATFDGPARALRCASAIVRGADHDVRAGLHSGECAVSSGDVGQLAVQIAQRVADVAGPSEVLVSQTVRDLALGSTATFCERGSHTFDGVPGQWRLYSVADI